jgi:hypothetical protein
MIEIPEIPHMSNDAINYLTLKFKSVNTYLEYGAGGSTVLAAKIGVDYCYSVESDPVFAEAVREKISIYSDVQVRFVLPDIGPVGEWGYPKDSSQCHKWHNYALYVWEIIRKNNRIPELILIDGRFRISCFLISLINSPPETAIVFDDYASRDARYSIVESIIKPEVMMGDSAIFRVPKDINKEICYLLLAKNIANKY